jgi:hypothetical protein
MGEPPGRVNQIGLQCSRSSLIPTFYTKVHILLNALAYYTMHKFTEEIKIILLELKLLLKN